MKKSNRISDTPIIAEVMPTIYQASHAGIKVSRYLSDPIRMKREADPKKEATKAIKIVTIMPVINIFFIRFLKALSISRKYSLRIIFASLSNAYMISFIDATNFSLLISSGYNSTFAIL